MLRRPPAGWCANSVVVDSLDESSGGGADGGGGCSVSPTAMATPCAIPSPSAPLRSGRRSSWAEAARSREATPPECDRSSLNETRLWSDARGDGVALTAGGGEGAYGGAELPAALASGLLGARESPRSISLSITEGIRAFSWALR